MAIDVRTVVLALTCVVSVGCNNGGFSGRDSKIEDPKKETREPFEQTDKKSTSSDDKRSKSVKNPDDTPDETINDRDDDTSADPEVIADQKPQESIVDPIKQPTVPNPVLPPAQTPPTVQPPVQPQPIPVQPLPPTQPTNPSERTYVPPTAPGNQGQGTISFPVAAASNMEGDFQFTTAGYRVFVTDQRGIVGAGVMTLHAALNAEPLDVIKQLPMDGTGGFKPLPVIVMKTDLQYVRPDARNSQGQGKIFVCMAQDPRAPAEQSACTRVSGEWGENWVDVQWDQGKDVSYTVDAQGHLKITGYADGLQLTGGKGFSLMGSRVPAASIMHPHEAPIAQANARSPLSDVDSRSPIVLDLDRNGELDLVDVWDDSRQIHFDISGNGEASRTGWVQPTDGLLALDVNGNGKIDSGIELFGQHSHVAFKRYHKQTSTTPFEHGYLALAQYDLNHDFVIDEKDAIYKLLLVWRDINQDGVSQPSELQSLAEAGVKKLHLASDVVGSRSEPVMNKNNFVRLVSKYEAADGKEYKTADIWFHLRRGRSVASYLEAQP